MIGAVKSSEFERLILCGARVRTLDDSDTRAEAIAFSAGRVAAVGTLAQARAAVPGAAERDLRGAAVYPGFVDAHHHFCFSATWGDRPSLRAQRTLERLLACVAEQVARTPPGEWVVLFGWDESQLEGGRGPTRSELDEIAPEHPVLLIHFSYHQGVLNRLGLERAGLLDRRPDPPGGFRGRTRTGELDGHVSERCFGHAEGIARRSQSARDPEAWFASANRYQQGVLAAGITHVCDAAVPPEMEALYRRWQARGELRLYPEERLAPREAVELYTRGAARVLGLEGEIGQLRPGSRADAVVLSDDPLEVPADRIRHISVLASYAGRCELQLRG
jgi:hypothetical protein